MINRHKLGFLKNILSLSNQNINYELLDQILFAIKCEEDLENDILDSYSNNQFKSKLNLINHVQDLDILNENSEIVIFGSWYGSILVPALSNKVAQVTCIDLDERALRIGKNYFFNTDEYKNVEWIVGDVFEDWRECYSTADLIINTSCEHMRPMSEWGPPGPRSLYKDSPFGIPETRKVPWWTRVKDNVHFAFQSNNMFGIEGHINCVNTIEEFKKQLPLNSNLLIEDEVIETRGSRYTLIGKIEKTDI